MFSALSALSSNKDRVGAVQAVCLFAVTLGSLIFTVYKSRIRTYQVTLSSFLGIGGGPINLVVLFFFFSMTARRAAENSLYIIFFSQITGLLTALTAGSIPDFPAFLLAFMVAGGIGGGIAGRMLSKRLSDDLMDRLFISLTVIILFVNVYNICRFTV